MKELSAFIRTFRLARGKRHGAGKAPFREAIHLARCSAYLAGCSKRRWLYPHHRAFRKLAG